MKPTPEPDTPPALPNAAIMPTTPTHFAQLPPKISPAAAAKGRRHDTLQASRAPNVGASASPRLPTMP